MNRNCSLLSLWKKQIDEQQFQQFSFIIWAMEKYIYMQALNLNGLFY